jgi:hypothetical protein
MELLLHLWQLVTSDVLTLAATSVLALAVLALLLVISWPSRGTAPHPAGNQRSAQARALFASGVPAMEVARRTGLSRDALALMIGIAGLPTRKKGPGAARLAFFRRATPSPTAAPSGRQVTA